ncbi:MAG: lipoyl synthase [bacterium]|nr:lipoyl synthase [bacterium]
MGHERLPAWVTNRGGDSRSTHEIKRLLRSRKVHTVCESAMCPNLGECFARDTATFMILGNDCTRQCAFCAVTHGVPAPIDAEEPARIVDAARTLNLKHVVITSVTRDDLPDGGSGLFVETINALRREIPAATIEVLTPDFQGDREAIRAVAAAGPHIYNHNLETVPRLYGQVRPQAEYERSLDLFSCLNGAGADVITKSGIMVGLGEERDEVVHVFQDLRRVGCDVITVGQYLRPRKKNFPVARYVPVDEFGEYEKIGYNLGFRLVVAGPLVRSSFRADEAMELLETGKPQFSVLPQTS